jgi:hypothetical protein
MTIMPSSGLRVLALMAILATAHSQNSNKRSPAQKIPTKSNPKDELKYAWIPPGNLWNAPRSRRYPRCFSAIRPNCPMDVAVTTVIINPGGHEKRRSQSTAHSAK